MAGPAWTRGPRPTRTAGPRMESSERTPRVSAVITAHDRRQYLRDAIESAVASGADEVVVVRNYSDPVEGYSGRFVDILEDRPETGVKEAVGLAAASGEVVAFLDDDDTWFPDKVSWLRDQWTRTEALAYLCHGQVPVDSAHRPVTAHHPEWKTSHGSDPAGFHATRELAFPEAQGRLWPGNNSSTVVDRAWAMRFAPYLRRAGWACDTFWLVACFASGAQGILTSLPKTYLRLHTENMSQTRGSNRENFRARHHQLAGRFAGAMDAMRAMVAAEGSGPARDDLLEYLSGARDGWALFRDVESGEVRRGEAARTGLSAHPMPGVRPVALLAAVSPALARWTLYQSGRRRWRTARVRPAS